MRTVDLNSDLGESFGIYRLGADTEVLRYVTSANIACGFHAGDPKTMATTVDAALKAGVAIGAHPGFSDLQGFGRRMMKISPDEAYNITLYQIGALKAFVDAAGGRLAHVKMHGALNNQAAGDVALAKALCLAVRGVDPSLIFVGIAGSSLVSAAHEVGVPVIQEVYADRTYQDDGSLTPRSDPRAMISDSDESIRQVMDMLNHGTVRTVSGGTYKIQPDTICIHGDQPGAPEFARKIRDALHNAGVHVAAPEVPRR